MLHYFCFSLWLALSSRIGMRHYVLLLLFVYTHGSATIGQYKSSSYKSILSQLPGKVPASRWTMECSINTSIVLGIEAMTNAMMESIYDHLNMSLPQAPQFARCPTVFWMAACDICNNGDSQHFQVLSLMANVASSQASYFHASQAWSYHPLAFALLDGSFFTSSLNSVSILLLVNAIPCSQIQLSFCCYAS